MPPHQSDPSQAGTMPSDAQPPGPPQAGHLAELAGIAQRVLRCSEAAEVILIALDSLAALADYEYALLELIPGFGQSGLPTVFRATPQSIEAVVPSGILVDDRALLLALEFGGRALGRLRIIPTADGLTEEQDRALRVLAGIMGLALRQAELETASRRLTELEVTSRRQPPVRPEPAPSTRRVRVGSLKAELSQILSAQVGLTLLCERILERLVTVLDVDAAVIYAIDERTNELVRSAQRGAPGPLPARLAIDPGAGPALGRAAAGGAPLLLRDLFAATLESDEDRVLRTWGFHTLLCYPLMAGKRVSGAIQFMSRQRDAISGDSLALMSSLSDEIALALQNAVVFERLSTMAVTDGLTGLHNRRFCEEFVRKNLMAAQRSRRTCGFLLLDVDHFKSFNDRFGHPAGDIVLQGVAGVLLASIRAADLAGRYGGEEFLVALPTADLPTAMAVGERIRSNVSQMPLPIGDRGEHVTVSVGVSCYPSTAADLAGLLASADAALYAAKQAGRNRVVAAPPVAAKGNNPPQEPPRTPQP